MADRRTSSSSQEHTHEHESVHVEDVVKFPPEEEAVRLTYSPLPVANSCPLTVDFHIDTDNNILLTGPPA